MQYYTIDEVKDILKISKRSVYKIVKDGNIKAVKVGNAWRISEEALNNFIETLETNLKEKE